MAEERVIAVADQSKHIDICDMMINVMIVMTMLGICYCIRLCAPARNHTNTLTH